MKTRCIYELTGLTENEKFRIADCGPDIYRLWDGAMWVQGEDMYNEWKEAGSSCLAYILERPSSIVRIKE